MIPWLAVLNQVRRFAVRPAANEPAPGPFPKQGRIGATESLVEVLALAGDALVLQNGTFVRMLEVTAVDLERGDVQEKHRFWAAFADVLRRLRAPLSVQIMVSTHPQDIGAYTAHWQAQAHTWQALAQAAEDDGVRKRRDRMGRSAQEMMAFLNALCAQIQPRFQRYLVVVTHNPFSETITAKNSAQILDDQIVTGALAKLDEDVRVVRVALSDLGLPVEALDGGAMCLAVWDHYHHAGAGRAQPRPGTQEFLEAARDSERLNDLLAPALIEEQTYSVRVGETLARGYVLYDFGAHAPVDFAAIAALPADITHTLYLAAADPAVIRQQFKEKETELRAATLVDAQRGAVTDWSRQAAVQSLEAARAEMETALQAPYFLHWYSLIWADDAEALEKNCQAFETLLKIRDIRYRPATRHHLSVVQSARPLGQQAYKLKPRNMSADSLGSFFPFVRREYLDPRGWHFGLHRGSGLLVCRNPFEDGQDNASQLIIGTPGSGKSVYLKQTIETVLALGHRVFVIDPEREYLRLAVDYHAPYIELGKPRQPERLSLNAAEAGSYHAGLVELGELYEALAATPLTAAQVDALTQAYQAVMAEQGVDLHDPASWSKPAPTRAALVNRLRAEAAPEARELARVLSYAEALSGGHVLNILDLNRSSENPWSAAAESLAAFVEALLVRRLEAAAFNALVEAYQKTMDRAGLRADDRTTWARGAPTLASLLEVLEAAPDPHSRELAQVLFPYARGLYAELFNQRTTVDARTTPFMVFGLRSLRENVERSLASVWVWQILQLVWNEVVAGGAEQPVHLFIDEAWYLLEQPGAAQRLERMARSFRKHNAALYLATQDAQRLIGSPEARAIAEIARLKMLFGQESESAVRGLGDLFGLTAAEQADLLRVRKGEGLLVLNPATRLPLYVAVNPRRLERLSTNRAQQQAVARASGRKAQAVR